jgi:hypothetical protein
VLVGLCILLVDEYRQVRQLSYMGAHQSLFKALHARGPVGASDANSVATWMTFDYIDHLFALPPQYLQTQLAITDKRYPHLTLAEYAEDHHLEQKTFLMQVQNAIRAYFTQEK